MEKMLLKIARQLDSLDEASLMSLWSKYATQTSRFEPTKRWEEACLVFSLIQAKRWKNQLFNYSWQQKRQPPVKNEEIKNLQAEDLFQLKAEEPESARPEEHCRILSFRQNNEMENPSSPEKE